MSADYMAENKVHKVRVEGNQHMDERAVLSRIGIRDGQSYSPAALSEKVQGAVTSLYQSGLFDDVTAWVDYVGDGSDVDLIFKIKELPALDTAIIDGCDEISEEDLRLKIRMIPGQVYSKSQLERDRQAMIDYYHSESSDGQEISAVFEEAQLSITAGQSAVLYDGDMVLGGGVIL